MTFNFQYMYIKSFFCYGIAPHQYKNIKRTYSFFLKICTFVDNRQSINLLKFERD